MVTSVQKHDSPYPTASAGPAGSVQSCFRFGPRPRDGAADRARDQYLGWPGRWHSGAAMAEHLQADRARDSTMPRYPRQPGQVGQV